MLTNGELALLSPLFGFLGVAAGTWATRADTRRQQEIEANQRRHDRRAAVYEDMLVELNRIMREQEKRIKAGPDVEPPPRDEQAAALDARWRARVAILAPVEVRDAYIEWVQVLMDRWEVQLLPSEERERARILWFDRMSVVTVKIGQLMYDDLEALSSQPVRRQSRFRLRLPATVTDSSA